MAKIVPADRQSLLDIALQTSGSIEAAFALAEQNNLSITDPLQIGSEIEMVEIVNNMVAERYALQGIHPATALTDGKATPPGTLGGIGYMAIEVDFVVS